MQKTTAAMFVLLLALIFIMGPAESQKLTWTYSPPTNDHGVPALAACYDRILKSFNNYRLNMEKRHTKWVNKHNSERDRVILLSGIGFGVVTAAVPPPWSFGVLVSGGYTLYEINKHYDDKVAFEDKLYNQTMEDYLEEIAGIELACESENLNGGDPENEADEDRMNDRSRGVQPLGVGFGMSIGGQSRRGTVTVQPVRGT